MPCTAIRVIDDDAILKLHYHRGSPVLFTQVDWNTRAGKIFTPKRVAENSRIGPSTLILSIRIGRISFRRIPVKSNSTKPRSLFGNSSNQISPKTLTPQIEETFSSTFLKGSVSGLRMLHDYNKGLSAFKVFNLHMVTDPRSLFDPRLFGNDNGKVLLINVPNYVSI